VRGGRRPGRDHRVLLVDGPQSDRAQRTREVHIGQFLPHRPAESTNVEDRLAAIETGRKRRTNNVICLGTPT